ncbi:MAG TPA: universal stress protein [Syntrophorhabdaceae bacterium]|nr:universal stress protein [Syntrophorhabdaceae bacterium]
MFAPKKILVPTDFSKFSDNALRQAYDMAKTYKAKIYLLHVAWISQICTIDYCLDQASVDALHKRTIKAAEDMMQKQIKRVVKSKDVEIIADITKGNPYEEILKEEKTRKIDLIVIASHGMTGILGHLMGSMAEKILRGAKCPVVLVKK